jgi:hypothetical protein
VIPNLTVIATDENTKAVRTDKTDASGHYLFSQVNQGSYEVTVQGSGFAAATSELTPVDVGRNVALNFSLHPESSSQTVEVSAQQGLLSLDNPNTTTTIDSIAIKNLPNPGQDLTCLAQFAQGGLMNTAGSASDAKAAGGCGNVEFNGLPATSNGSIRTSSTSSIREQAGTRASLSRTTARRCGSNFRLCLLPAATAYRSPPLAA